jgi:hypothetical protein
VLLLLGAVLIGSGILRAHSLGAVSSATQLE